MKLNRIAAVVGSLALLIASTAVANPSDPKRDCVSGQAAACADVDIKDRDAKAMYRKGCDAKDGYSCTRLGQYLETVEKDIEGARKLYRQGCELKDSFGCDYEIAFVERKTLVEVRSRRNAGIGKSIRLPTNSVGVVRRLGTTANAYKLEIVFPAEIVRDPSNAKWKISSQTSDLRSEDVFPFSLNAPLELFDAEGSLGEIQVATLESRLFCENDGGLHWRPSSTLEVPTNSLARKLVTKSGAGDYVAFARVKASASLPGAQGLANKTKVKSSIEGRLTKDGEIVARLDFGDQSKMEEGGSVRLSTHQGIFQLECTGP